MLHRQLPVVGEPADRPERGIPTDDTAELLQDAATDTIEYLQTALVAGLNPEDVARHALDAFPERCLADSAATVSVGLTHIGSNSSCRSCRPSLRAGRRSARAVRQSVH